MLLGWVRLTQWIVFNIIHTYLFLCGVCFLYTFILCEIVLMCTSISNVLNSNNLVIPNPPFFYFPNRIYQSKIYLFYAKKNFCSGNDFHTGKYFSEALILASTNRVTKDCSWNYHEQSFVILWVSWCKNKCFWKRFTCNLELDTIGLFLQNLFCWLL